MPLIHKGPRVQVQRRPRINEVVLIDDSNLSRGNWQLGKIIELNAGNDGNIRSVKVQLGNRNIITRPVSLIYPLEIEANEELIPGVEGREELKEAEEVVTEVQTDTTITEQNRSPDISVNRVRSKSFSPKRNVVTLRTLQFATMTLFFFNLLIFVNGSLCPKDIGEAERVYAQKCKKEGLVIMRLKSNKLCYIKKTCPIGFITEEGICAPKSECQCPAWTDKDGSCTLHNNGVYQGKPLVIEDAEGKPIDSADSILSLARPNVCSFKVDDFVIV